MREPKLGVAVGKKGVGKTYTTTKIISEYINGSATVQPRRVLILDVNDEFENIKGISVNDIKKFSMHPKVEARRIRPFNDDGSKLTLRDISDILFKILNDFRGGLLLIEDINKYISDHLPNDLVGAICTNRHSNMDIIMHFQSIGRITPKIWQNLNWIRFHKNSDSVDTHKRKFEDKHEYLKIAECMISKAYKSGDERFYLYVDLDYEKIYGEFSPAMLKDAIDEYVGDNYNKLIAPKLNRRDSSGKKAANPREVIMTVKDDLYRDYNGNK